MNPDVSIHKVTGRHSEVTYRPTLRDQAVFSSTGVKAQFIVRYDVARELAAADFQVRLAETKRQSSFYREIMISRKKMPKQWVYVRQHLKLFASLLHFIK